MGPFPTLNVYEGTTDVAIPITVGSEVLDWPIRNKPKTMEIPVDIVYQACSETVCFVPKQERVKLAVPITSLVMPGR